MVGFPAACKPSEKGEMTSGIARLRTKFDVFGYMKRVTKSYKSRSFLIFNLSPIKSYDLQSNVIMTSWSPDLVSSFSHADIVSSAPMLHRLQGSAVPFFCDANEADVEDEGIAKILALLKRHHVERCGHFPVHDASGARGCVSLTGDRESFTEQEMSEISYIAIHVFERLSEISEMETQVNETLSDREIDCLHWTAAGKTSAEIAHVMGLSEHTVNHYLNRATKKLDTVNRTQAVAKALRLGLIE